jgi:Mn-dependent DtxR family transcriptional regulator
MSPDETADMLSSVEMDVLASLLIAGDNTPSNIADDTDRHKTSVSDRLSDLQAKGLVENKGRGVWTLTISGANLARTVIRHRRKNGEDPPL